VEEFRARLTELRSLNDLQALCRELAEREVTERVALPFFVVRSVLEGVHERLADRPVETATWRQVQDALGDALPAVIDAYQAGNQERLFERLNALGPSLALPSCYFSADVRARDAR